MEEHCPTWNTKTPEEKFSYLSDMWEALPDALRRQAWRSVSFQLEAESSGDLTYLPEKHGSYEDYLKSHDFTLWLARPSPFKEEQSQNGYGYSYAASFDPHPGLTCEGCRYDYPMGHPSQHYHSGEGGCLNEGNS